MPRADMMSPLERPSALRRIACSTISCVSFALRPAMRGYPLGRTLSDGYSFR